jgi:hypothetical protein
MSLMSLNLPLPDDEAAEAAGRPDPATATSAIAEVRRLLATPGILTHPAIRDELFKLDEQLSAGLPCGERTPGRHRSRLAARSRRLALGPGSESLSPIPDHERDDQADEGGPDDQDRADAGGDRAPQVARPR